MMHLLILAVHLLATIAKLVRPGGVRAVVAESLVLRVCPGTSSWITKFSEHEAD
jgi:hypothetical protein